MEVRLPARFAVEADALYQRIGYSNVFNLNDTNLFQSRERGNSWEFPLLVKYYFRPQSESWQPFVGTGFAFRTTSFHSDYSESPTGAFHQDYRSGLEPARRFQPASVSNSAASRCCRRRATRIGATPTRASAKTKRRFFWG